jgi:peptidoglycan/xylan/chitin deacetylase (PgdA/CDA1 family)
MTSTESPGVALTFDDGPGPSTGRLLDVLAQHGARATFFFLGRNLHGDALGGDRALAEQLAARTAREGHLLGNHTVTHASTLAPDDLLAEVAACDQLVQEAYRRAGRPGPEWIPVRLPFGPFRPDGAVSVAALARHGRPHCHWTGDPQDYQPQKTADQIASAVLAHVEKAWAHQRTPIVLLHDAGPADGDGGVVRETTVDAVDRVCMALAARATHYLTLSECDPKRYRLPGPRAAD